MINDKNKKVLAFCGSTRKDSTNLQILQAIEKLTVDNLEFEFYNELTLLPHFNPDLDKEVPPLIVQVLRNKITDADGILICTPEYVFSLPGSLKNMIEWTVSTTIFSNKPTAIITASGLGEKAHESLLLIMKTIEAKMPSKCQLLIQGARSKVNAGGITDENTLSKINELIVSFVSIINEQCFRLP